MARELRVEYPGAIYHAMNRGDWKEPIFRDDSDRFLFLFLDDADRLFRYMADSLVGLGGVYRITQRGVEH